MSNKGKYIGLNQRIPFEVLDTAIHFFMDKGTVDKLYILKSMEEFTTGVNRANKATTYVTQILNRQVKLLEKLKKALDNTPYNSWSIDDRKSLCLCLISLTYPIAYDLLVALAQGFKVQSKINKKFISEKVMSIYGSNRTVDVAIDALLPMIIEYKTIKREKVSIYSIATKLVVTTSFISELIIYTDIKLSGSKSLLFEDLTFRPWYAYFEFFGSSIENCSHLIKKKESAIGRGYLTI